MLNGKPFARFDRGIIYQFLNFSRYDFSLTNHSAVLQTFLLAKLAVVGLKAEISLGSLIRLNVVLTLAGFAPRGGCQRDQCELQVQERRGRGWVND